MPRGLLLYPAALFGGVVLTTIVWFVILYFKYRQQIERGYAMAGGWTYLLNTPWVVVLLTFGFGIGFYLVTLLLRPLMR